MLFCNKYEISQYTDIMQSCCSSVALYRISAKN